MDTDIRIVALPAGEIGSVAKSFASAFHVYRSHDAWRRRFIDAPAKAMVAYAPDRAEPLAFYGAMLHQATWQGRALRVGHIVDVFSHPDARHVYPHIFEHTARAFFDQFCGPDRIQVLYGFPSPGPSRQGERFLAYRRLQAPRWYRCDLGGLSLDAGGVSFAGEVIALDDLHCVGGRIQSPNKEWLFFDMSDAALCQRFPLKGAGAPYRAWGLRQTGGDALLGVVILRLDGDMAWLMGLHLAEVHLAQGFWLRIAQQLRDRGAKKVAVMFGGPHPLSGLISRLGFSPIDAMLPLIPTFRVFDDSIDGDLLANHFPYDLFHTDIF